MNKQENVNTDFGAVTPLKCEKCKEHVNAYILTWNPQWWYNCYNCNSFYILDGGYGTVSVTPNFLNETISIIDNKNHTPPTHT